MTRRSRTLEALSVLLPAGALGVSVALASTPAEALAAPGQDAVSKIASGHGVAARLEAIRNGVSEITGETANEEASGYPNVLKAWWRNGWGRGWGWRNGGWGWRNGGWGWRNGGWRNGGWPNFWSNW